MANKLNIEIRNKRQGLLSKAVFRWMAMLGRTRLATPQTRSTNRTLRRRNTLSTAKISLPQTFISLERSRKFSEVIDSACRPKISSRPAENLPRRNTKVYESLDKVHCYRRRICRKIMSVL